MGIRYRRLLAQSQRKVAFRSLLIFSSYVYSPYIFALSAFQATSGFINTGIKILNDEKVDGATHANIEIWKFFGFESAEEMNTRLEELSYEHSKVLEGIADKSATIENLAVIPDGFEGPSGIIKNGQFKPKTLLASAASSASSNGMMASLGAPTIKANLAAPLSIAEGGSGVAASACKPGSVCAVAKDLSDSFSKDAPYLSADDLSTKASSGRSVSARSPAASPSFNPIAHKGFQIAAASNPQYANTMRDNLSSYTELGNKEKLDTKSLESFANLAITDVLAKPEIFNIMPEGWFSETKTIPINGKDVKVMIRGSLDRPYNSKDPNDINNFYQIAPLEEVPGMKPGIITLKKEDPAATACNGGICNLKSVYSTQDKKNKLFFDKLWAQRNGKQPIEKLKLPDMQWVTTGLSKFVTALNNPSSLLETSEAFEKQFQNAILKQNNLGKIKLDQRWSREQFLQQAQPESIEYYIKEMAGIPDVTET